MTNGCKWMTAVALSVALGAPVGAQVLMQRNVSLDMAKTIADAALAMCAARGYSTSVAVVDRAGQTVLLMRSNDATPQTPEMARRKAYTARMFRRTSADWAARTLEDPVRLPQRDLADVLALGGGVPIMIGDETIGGAGSAGSTQQLDNDCAQAGVDAAVSRLQ